MEEKNEMSLFAAAPAPKKKEVNDVIGISFMHFIKDVKMTAEELFSGYTDLKVMTYTYSLPYIEKLISHFAVAEVIVSPAGIRADTAELLAAQAACSNEVIKREYLKQRILDGTFHLYAASDIVQHAKVYLLKAEDGRVRTIWGSANASFRAWDGSQLENFTACDDPDYYEMQLALFNTLKEISTDDISIPAKEIKEDGSNLEEIPMIKKIKTVQNAAVIRDAPTEETDYAFVVGKISEKAREIIRKAGIRPTKKDGGTLLDLKKVKEFVKVANLEKQERQKRQIVCPSLVVNYEDNTVSINDKIQKLSPSMDEVRSNILLLNQYFDGFDSFTGNVSDLKHKAWKLLVHMFASPFFAKLRYEGDKAEYPVRRFPNYVLLYGSSDNGKTALVETIQKLMLNRKPRPLSKTYFSVKPDKMPALQTQIKGCPILIDDIESPQWRNAGNISKGDQYLIDEHYTNHPTFVITANELGSVKPEVSKRIVILHVNNRLSKSLASAKSSEINALRNRMTNALYRAYLAKMFPLVEEMIQRMLTEDDDFKWQPDIYKASSTVLLDIFKEAGITVPKEFTVLTWDNLMGDAAVSEQALTLLKEMYHLNSDMFTAKKNELRIDLGSLPNKEEFTKKLVELPADFEYKCVGSIITMKKDEAELYTGIKFGRSHWLSRLFGR